MSDHKRLFVGARVSVGTANALSGAVEILARRARDGGIDVRWVAPVNYHVTIAFLGNTRVDAISAVLDALEAATQATPRISFRTARLGAFPSLDKARVIWAGIDEPAQALDALAKRVDKGLADLGVAAADRKPFHAHVTLGRVRETRPLKEVVLPIAEQMFGETRIDGITLFESETKSGGSVYREVARIAFKPADSLGLDASKRQTLPLDVGADLETDDGWPRGHRTD